MTAINFQKIVPAILDDRRSKVDTKNNDYKDKFMAHHPKMTAEESNRLRIISGELSEAQAYGLWNSLCAYKRSGDLIATIPAHPGFIFPESPSDYIEALRKAVISGDNNFQFWPIRVDIDVTQKCNNNCRFCYSRLYANESLYANAEMSAWEFERISQELSLGGTKCIRFTGGGEPLLNPEIKKMLPIPKSLGLKSCIITNGHLLNEEINELLVSNVDHIRISLNASTDNTRKYLHRPAVQTNNLSDIVKEISNLVNFRNNICSSERKPLIWVTFLIVPQNIREIYSAAKVMKDCGVDSISFRSVYHNLARKLSAEEVNMLQKELKLASSLDVPPTFQVFIPKRDINSVWKIAPQNQFKRCLQCHLITIIEMTNQGPMIKICDVNRGYHGEKMGVPGKSLGTLDSRNNFTKVWGSNYAKTTLLDRPHKCGEHCIASSMNNTLNNVWDTLSEHHDAIFIKSWCSEFETKKV